MNTKKSGNYQGDIHNVAYRQPYLEKAVTRRDMVADAGREMESLDGEWNFFIDQYDTFLRARWYQAPLKDAAGRSLPVDFDFDQWDRIRVPSCWNTQAPEYFYYEGTAVYTRTFEYHPRGEKHAVLKIGAANYESFVFLNGQFVGCHRGGSTPAYFDITAQLATDNRISIVVNDTRRQENVPAENTDWFNYGGIFRSVELLRLPEVFIRDFRLTLVPGSGFGKIRASVALSAPAAVSGRLSVPELGVDRPFETAGGKWEAEIDCSPELWSPDHPKLYDVRLTAGADALTDRIGFREIRVEGLDVLLNGEKIYLKGISCHEDSVSNGRAVTEDEIVENLRLAKELGCNYMRLAHYPHTEKVARTADRLGLMLWEEIPVYWAIDFENPDTLADAKNQLEELITRDCNRASVVIWSVGNENADTDARLHFMKTLAETAKAEDPTRLVSAACLVDIAANKIADRLADSLDIIGINEYYGWYNPNFALLPECFANSRVTKPVVISEYGAGARAGCRGTSDDLFTEDMQKAVYEKQVATLGAIPVVRGMSPWILFDFRCPRRHNRYQRGYNLKGLLSADKKTKKLAFYVLQRFYATR